MKKNKLIDYICKGDLNNLASKIHLPDEINICDSDRRSLLINAIIENQPKIITFLLEKGADVNLQDKDGLSALHFASRKHQIETAKQLICLGASIDCKDRNGNSPLSDAVFESQGRGEMIKLLLQNGANKHLENEYGISPFALAKSIGNYDIAKFLEEA